MEKYKKICPYCSKEYETEIEYEERYDKCCKGFVAVKLVPLQWREKEENNASLMHQEKKKKHNTYLRLAKVYWNSSEDLKLKELVGLFGPRKWTKIAEKMNGRTGKSCRSRWAYHLNPMINKREFSDEENKKLIEAQREMGNNWALIAKSFHGRTNDGVRNQWRYLMGTNLGKQSSMV